MATACAALSVRTSAAPAFHLKGKLVNRHRPIRRGIPYGDPLPQSASDDGQARGVIFMCLQASIARPFEFIPLFFFGSLQRVVTVEGARVTSDRVSAISALLAGSSVSLVTSGSGSPM